MEKRYSTRTDCIDAALPVAVPVGDSIPFVRDMLGAMGYAVAYSSFSSNGYDFDDGVRRTHQLRGLFKSQFGNPTRSYLVGHSLGSQISEAMAERYGSQYDGAFLMCGVLGGSRIHFNWVGSVRALFDFFYPGVLPGDASYFPPDLDPYTTGVRIPALTAIAGNPQPAFYIAAITQTPLAGGTPQEIVTSLVTALIWHARGIGDVTDRAHGQLAFDNSNTTYTSPLLPAALMAQVNAGVRRYSTPPAAQTWLEHNYQPSGRVRFPVLTLHTTNDPSVPFFHESAFASYVASAGTGDMVLQRSIDRYGHCAFTVAEVIANFSDLVQWVQSGTKPGS